MTATRSIVKTSIRSPTLIGDRHQFVWEVGANLAGWLEVIYGQKSQYLDLMIDPKYDAMDALIAGFPALRDPVSRRELERLELRVDVPGNLGQ